MLTQQQSPAHTHLELDYFHHPLILSYLPANATELGRQQEIQRLRTLSQIWYDTGLWSIYNLVIIQAERFPNERPLNLLPDMPAHVQRRALHRVVSETEAQALVQQLNSPLRSRQHQDPDFYLPVATAPENDGLYSLVRQYGTRICAPDSYSLYHGYCDRSMKWNNAELVQNQLMEWVFQSNLDDFKPCRKKHRLLSSVQHPEPCGAQSESKAQAKTFARPQRHHQGPSHTSA